MFTLGFEKLVSFEVKVIYGFNGIILKHVIWLSVVNGRCLAEQGIEILYILFLCFPRGFKKLKCFSSDSVQICISFGTPHFIWSHHHLFQSGRTDGGGFSPTLVTMPPLIDPFV